jgi:hypothetical protein
MSAAPVLLLFVALFAVTLIGFPLLLLLGPLIFFILLIVIAAVVAWWFFRPTLAMSGWFASLRLLCLLLRQLPKLGPALIAAADGMDAAAAGLSLGKTALDRVEADLDSAGALLRSVTFPKPEPIYNNLQDMIGIDMPDIEIAGFSIDVHKRDLVVGFTPKDEALLAGTGDLLIRQASAIRTTGSFLQEHIILINTAARDLREIGQALAAAE